MYELDEVSAEQEAALQAAWSRLKMMQDPKGDFIISIASEHEVYVGQLLEYAGWKTARIFDDAIREGMTSRVTRSVAAEWLYVIKPFVENVLRRATYPKEVLRDSLSHFSTCDPVVAAKLAERCFRGVVTNKSPSHVRYGLFAHIGFGARQYGSAVLHAELAWCNKELPGYDGMVQSAAPEADEVFERAEAMTAEFFANALARNRALM